jgi:hydroxymethylbilane synthase
VECREDDEETLNLLSGLHHRETVLATVAERAFMKTLEGGCSVPVAVNTSVSSVDVSLTGGVWSLDGSKSLKATKTEQFKENSSPKRRKSDIDTFAAIKAENLDQDELIAAEFVGRSLAEELLSQGAKSILEEAKSQNDKK